MSHPETLLESKFVGWPQSIEVWHFDRSKGFTNIGIRKKTQPCKVTPITIELKELLPQSATQKDKENESNEIIPFSILPQNFCKKDIKTGLQKQLRCQVCKCLMESTNALQAHLKSQKHCDSYDVYIKNGSPQTLLDVTKNESGLPEQESLCVQSMKPKRKSDKSITSDQKRRKVETKGEKSKRITDRPGFGQDKYDETSYYFDINKCLRKVYPYYFTFTTFTKGRWVGEGILDVFSREFRAHSSDEYRRCIEEGTLTVNGKKVNIDYKLEHNDMLANVVHRHEVPVTSDSIKIIHKDSDLVVIDKPPSIPVHPCGRYRYNTVAYILAKEHDLKFLKTIHRLDRLTSGVLMFGRTPKKAHEMEQQIRARSVEKIYLCLVEGEFPSKPESKEIDVMSSNVISCKMPIEVVSHKIGVCRVSPGGKPCHTDFQRLSYDGKNSVVLCRPKTGRMHQIRVHLQYLGYPILNDPLYNSPAFGPNKGKAGDIGGKTYSELIQELIRLHSVENWVEFEANQENELDKSTISGNQGASIDVHKPKLMSNCTSDVDLHIGENDKPKIFDNHSTNEGSEKCSVITSPSIEKPALIIQQNDPQVIKMEANDDLKSKIEKVNQLENTEICDRPTLDLTKLSTDKNCKECTLNYSDPNQEQLVMYLHAYKYSGDGWTFETKIPSWAGANITNLI